MKHSQGHILQRVDCQPVEVHAGAVHLGVAQGDDVGVGAGLGKPVHREEVCDSLFAIHEVFYHVGPDDVLLWQQVVDDLLLIVLVLHFILGLLLFE